MPGTKRRVMLGFGLLCLVAAAQADSLYHEDRYVGLYSDPRAMRTGETLTVLIYEQASAATRADRATNESASLSGSVRTDGDLDSGQVDIANDSKGGGTLTRSGQLIASVSVTVDEVLPNGELRVSGEQLIEFNEENQHIKIAGRVRPEDISAENTVISTRLADAQITYVGDGLLGRQQKPGLITRLFQWLF